MPGTRVVLVLVAVLWAGCTEVGGERPGDWASGEPLTSFAGWRYHSADEGQSLYAPEGGPAPLNCVAYQDGTAMASDTCTVEGPQRGWNDAGQSVTRGPWTLNATWDGRGEDLVETETDTARRTVVAFDAEGRPAYHWDGLRREGPMAVE